MPQLGVIYEQDVSGLQDASKNEIVPFVTNEADSAIDISVAAESRQLLHTVLMEPFADGWRGTVVIVDHALALKEDFSIGVDAGRAGENLDKRSERSDFAYGDFCVGSRCVPAVGVGIDWMEEVSMGRFDHVPAADQNRAMSLKRLPSWT
jgi:hypothetical protein